MQPRFKTTIMLFGLLAGLAASASAEKRPLYLVCTASTNDSVGMRLCTELRNGIEASPRYREITDTKQFHWGLNVVTIKITDTEMSAQSVAIVLGGNDGLSYFMSSYVMTTGTSRVKEQAETILAALDEEVDAAEKAAATTAK